jgi:hypothetical protein
MDCEGCGMCCYIPPMPWLGKEHSVWCQHYIPNKGCRIHGNHPQQCKDFTCWYMDSENLPDDINPKYCGCIIEKYDDIFMITTDPRSFDSWKNVTPFIDQVCKKGYSIVITSYTNKQRFVIAEQGKSEEVWNKIVKMAREEYGSTKL